MTVEVVPIPPAPILPAQSIADSVAAFAEYQTLKKELGDPNVDFTRIGSSVHPNKSFVSKLRKFFAISCEVTRDEMLVFDDKLIGWIVTVRASHSSGQYQDGDGTCELKEKNPNQQTIHNVRAHAVTRAKGRAVMDLVGFGDVTAEEIQGEEPRTPRAGRSEPEEVLVEVPEGEAGVPPAFANVGQLLTWFKTEHNMSKDDVLKTLGVESPADVTDLEGAALSLGSHLAEWGDAEG